MTNEQLAVYVLALEGRVRALAAAVEASVRADEWETHTVWTGEELPPTLAGIDAILSWKTGAALDEANWREERTRPAAVALVYALADELAEQAEALWERRDEG